MSFLSTQPYKGTRDFYPEEKRLQSWLFETLRRVVGAYAYQEYDGPMLESFELYAAKTGSEIVNQQLYSLIDRGERKVAIRPEMTPTLARMVAGRLQELPKPVRWYSIPNLWRYERPQKGRLREHWQLNVDVLGGDSLLADFEILSLAVEIFRALKGEKHIKIRVNNRRLIDDFFRKTLGLDESGALQLSKIVDAKDKLPAEAFVTQVGALGLNDEKQKLLREFFASSLPEIAKKYPDSVGVKELSSLMKLVVDAKLQDQIVFDATIMRGLDYYTGTVFEAFDVSPENPRALFGGGRYDNLIGLFGKQQLSGIGFGMGDVVLMSFLETHKLLPSFPAYADVFVGCAGLEHFSLVSDICRELRAAGLKVVQALEAQGFGAQLKSANKLGLRFAVLLGEDELKRGELVLKDLDQGKQQNVRREDLAKVIQSERRQS